MCVDRHHAQHNHHVSADDHTWPDNDHDDGHPDQVGFAANSNAPPDGRRGQLSQHIMKDHVYKLIELTGTSKLSMEDAVNNAVRRAHKTVKNLRWFQVTETRGDIVKGRVDHWQVTVKVGYPVEG